MGVLKVNVGTAGSPDWRNIGCGGSAGGTTSFTDAFTGADGDSLSAGWVELLPIAPWRIASNQARVVTSASGNASPVVREFGGADGTVAVDIAVAGSGTWGLVFRVSVTSMVLDGALRDVVGFWYADRSGLLRCEGGYFDSLGNYTGTGSAVTAVATWTVPTAPFRLSVTLAGSSITVTNVTTSATLGSTTDSFNATATRHGMAAGPTNARFDNFAASITVPATVGRLKLWDGTRWVREVCDDDTTPANATVNGWTITPAPPDIYVNGNYWDITSPASLAANRYVKLNAFTGTVANTVGSTINNTNNVGNREILFTAGGVQTDTFNIATGGGFAITHWVISMGAAGDPSVVQAIFTAVPVIERHPLKMWDGTTWQTVACMVPA